MDAPPQTGSEWYSWAWISFLAGMGGVVSYYQRLKTNKGSAFTFAEFVGEVTTSCFCGWLTYLICLKAGTSLELTSAFAGLAGHAGARFLFKAERWMIKRFGMDDTNVT